MSRPKRCKREGDDGHEESAIETLVSDTRISLVDIVVNWPARELDVLDDIFRSMLQKVRDRK